MPTTWGEHEFCPKGWSKTSGHWRGWWVWRYPPDAEIPDEEQLSDETYRRAVQEQMARGWFECSACGERRYAGPEVKVAHQAPPPWEQEVIPVVPPSGWRNPSG